jgi:hypothetical protein
MPGVVLLLESVDPTPHRSTILGQLRGRLLPEFRQAPHFPALAVKYLCHELRGYHRSVLRSGF